MKTRKIAYLGMLMALALVLSYVESLIPFAVGIPGVKLGLTNIVTVIMLYTSYSDNIERSCPFSTTALVPEQSIYNTTYTYDFYDVGTYLDCSVGCYFGVVGSSKPIYWSATTQVTIPKL